MLYLHKNNIYVKANNKYFKVKYANDDIKPTKEELYSIDTSKPISYEQAIETLKKKNSIFNDTRDITKRVNKNIKL